MSSTWVNILAAFEPEYYELEEKMNLGPNIRCKLLKKGRYTVLQLEEIWSNIDHVYHTTKKSDKFDDYVFWTNEQLTGWKNVKRMYWDQWYFNTKKDAEKFVILFNLKWAK
jgi:hypothetical protein